MSLQQKRPLLLRNLEAKRQTASTKYFSSTLIFSHCWFHHKLGDNLFLSSIVTINIRPDLSLYHQLCNYKCQRLVVNFVVPYFCFLELQISRYLSNAKFWLGRAMPVY